MCDPSLSLLNVIKRLLWTIMKYCNNKNKFNPLQFHYTCTERGLIYLLSGMQWWDTTIWSGSYRCKNASCDKWQHVELRLSFPFSYFLCKLKGYESNSFRNCLVQVFSPLSGNVMPNCFSQILPPLSRFVVSA